MGTSLYYNKNLKMSLDDVEDVQSLLVNLVKDGTITPTADTYYPIHFAPNIEIALGSDRSCEVFCAYHGISFLSFSCVIIHFF